MKEEMVHVRKVFLDSSALVAWVYGSHEGEGFGEIVANFCRKPSNQAFTNELCIAEAMNVFKRNLRRKRINEYGYGLLTYKLCRMIEQKSFKIAQFARWDREFSEKILEYCKKHAIDIIDCMQIVEVLNGEFSKMVGASQTILVTQDSDLASAAREEGCKVWLFNKESELL